MTYFCTLFDSNYASRGLALIESLNRVTKDFKLYVLAFDQAIYEYLISQEIPNIEIIAMKDFEDQALLRIKPTRNRAEYCWTCTPSLIKYCLEVYNLDQCTYLDADLYFYSDPKILLSEMKDQSVLITDHRYTPEYNQSLTSGKYCVQFVSFKNNSNGMKVLSWWRERCLEWCYARAEDGKFGDQKYLDNWTRDFSGVHELKHLGGGVAPWNVQQYKIQHSDEQNISLIENVSGDTFPLIFYHFHALKIFKDYYDLGNYKLGDDIKTHLYGIYLENIKKIDRELREKRASFNWHAMVSADKGFKSKIRVIKRKVLGTYNIVPS